MIGIAIASSSVGVGGHCPWIRPGVGVVTVQHYADPRIATEILSAMGDGSGPADAIDAVMSSRVNKDMRQIGAMNVQGRTGAFSGGAVEAVSGVAHGVQCLSIGNVLVNEDVLDAMVSSFERGQGEHLADRLLGALNSGVDEGGEIGQLRSSALLVSHLEPWPRINLRVDWSQDNPVEDLAGVWERYRPDTENFVTWAIDP